MAAPSRLPSALEVARRCFDRHQAIRPDLPVVLRDDLEGLANYFLDRDLLLMYFVTTLVPWTDVVAREPNVGHEAVADFLLTGAARFAVTTNFDWLIETAGWHKLGEDLQASLTGAEAVQHEQRHSPLLKLHGCGNRNRQATIWTRRQLGADPIRTTLMNAREWLAVNLQQKDLVVIGFWTDWAYLITVLEESLVAAGSASVLVVNPDEAASLQAKAPRLWDLLSSTGAPFRHERMSAEVFLEELREAFSRRYLRQLLAMGEPQYVAAFGAPPGGDWLTGDDTPREALYDRRRDAEGRRVGRAARRREPTVDAQGFAFFLLALRRAGGQPEGPFFRLADKLVRVINCAGAWLAEIQREYAHEPAGVLQADIIACVGAQNIGVPSSIVRGATPASTVRAGLRGEWLDNAASWTLLGL
jgi:hypothetical protein